MRDPRNSIGVPATRPGDVGSEIEDRAVAWWGLHRPGSRLLARNYRRRGGEIDLIFEELRRPVGGDASRVELVFVEVRARRGADAWVSGAESVDYRKRLRLERTARDFLWRYRGGAQAVRFDVLDWDGNGFTHLEAAWSPRA